MPAEKRQRQTTAYLVFCQHERERIIQELSMKPNPNLMLFIVSSAWKFLTPDEKQKYSDEAQAHNSRVVIMKKQIK